MKINFDKTDRLIELIEDSCHVFTHFAWRSKDGLQKRHNDLYENLAHITASKGSEKQKQLERIKAFADEYKLGNDLEKAEALLKLQFDEEAVLKYLTRVYWQIQTLVIITDNSGNNFADKEGLKKLIEKSYPNEPHKDVIADVISKQEPRINDIEKEFWNNCTDTDKINDYCNIYRERWRTHLKEVDEHYYNFNSILFDKQNELHNYFKDLRKCGLLQQEELYAECRLGQVARQINIICNNVVELFKRFRASTITDGNKKEATHREIILAHNFKIEAKIADFKTSSDWEKEGGPKRKQNFYTLDINNKNKYRAASKQEIKKAIELLKDFPSAQNLAINKLDEL